MSDHAHLAGPEARKRIWTVFWILGAITALEFVIAFTMDRGMSRNLIFIIMTLFKAFGIVAYFMHMWDEVRGLILSVMLPMIFVVWFIIALLIEGSHLENGWFAFMAG